MWKIGDVITATRDFVVDGHSIKAGERYRLANLEVLISNDFQREYITKVAEEIFGKPLQDGRIYKAKVSKDVSTNRGYGIGIKAGEEYLLTDLMFVAVPMDRSDFDAIWLQKDGNADIAPFSFFRSKRADDYGLVHGKAFEDGGIYTIKKNTRFTSFTGSIYDGIAVPYAIMPSGEVDSIVYSLDKKIHFNVTFSRHQVSKIFGFKPPELKKEYRFNLIVDTVQAHGDLHLKQGVKVRVAKKMWVMAYVENPGTDIKGDIVAKWLDENLK